MTMNTRRSIVPAAALAGLLAIAAGGCTARAAGDPTTPPRPTVVTTTVGLTSKPVATTTTVDRTIDRTVTRTITTATTFTTTTTQPAPDTELEPDPTPDTELESQTEPSADESAVTGQVTWPDGTAAPGTWVEFKAQDGCLGVCQQLWTPTDSDGSYSMDLPDGLYLALCGSDDDPGLNCYADDGSGPFVVEVPPRGQQVDFTLEN